MITRAANNADASVLATLFNGIIAIGGTTAHEPRVSADTFATHAIT